MDFSDVRRITIVALFSDDLLHERLVLKGGTALNLIYGLTSRTSLDLDFSMSADFEDIDQAGQRMFRAIRDRFDAEGFVVFDERLEPKPRLHGEDTKPWWGGYELRFKLIEREKYEKLRTRPEKLRLDALVTGSEQNRTFTVDLSKHEYVEGRVEQEFEHYSIYVYSPEMIVVEKLRALCQQMEAYEHRVWRSPRARDFYDICTVVQTCGIDLGSASNHNLARHIFAAKHVPLSFLASISNEREFHRTDWPAVINTTAGGLGPFDYYFDFVLGQVELLKSLWVE
jgi:predicted nucleotidyltransferase component of viral defense system